MLRKKVKVRKRKLNVKPLPVEEKVENLVEIEETEESTSVEMTDHEDVDLEDMSNLFFIVKGQYAKRAPRVMVHDGKDFQEVYIGGYDPSRAKVEQYMVYDKVTFHCIYGGSSLEKALDCIKRAVVTYKNNPENYFRMVGESTNEDFYYRHYLGKAPYSESRLKKEAENGKSWRTGTSLKRLLFAVEQSYAFTYEDAVYNAYEESLKTLEKRKTGRKRMLRKARKLKRKLFK